jgi:hypothetical protein
MRREASWTSFFSAIEARAYASADAFRAALDAAPLECLDGKAVGTTMNPAYLNA